MGTILTAFPNHEEWQVCALKNCRNCQLLFLSQGSRVCPNEGVTYWAVYYRMIVLHRVRSSGVHMCYIFSYSMSQFPLACLQEWLVVMLPGPLCHLGNGHHRVLLWESPVLLPPVPWTGQSKEVWFGTQQPASPWDPTASLAKDRCFSLRSWT